MLSTCFYCASSVVAYVVGEWYEDEQALSLDTNIADKDNRQVSP